MSEDDLGRLLKEMHESQCRSALDLRDLLKSTRSLWERVHHIEAEHDKLVARMNHLENLL
jgi:hypothetical protein